MKKGVLIVLLIVFAFAKAEAQGQLIESVLIDTDMPDIKQVNIITRSIETEDATVQITELRIFYPYTLQEKLDANNEITKMYCWNAKNPLFEKEGVWDSYIESVISPNPVLIWNDINLIDDSNQKFQVLKMTGNVGHNQYNAYLIFDAYGNNQLTQQSEYKNQIIKYFLNPETPQNNLNYTELYNEVKMELFGNLTNRVYDQNTMKSLKMNRGKCQMNCLNENGDNMEWNFIDCTYSKLTVEQREEIIEEMNASGYNLKENINFDYYLIQKHQEYLDSNPEALKAWKQLKSTLE